MGENVSYAMFYHPVRSNVFIISVYFIFSLISGVILPKKIIQLQKSTYHRYTEEGEGKKVHLGILNILSTLFLRLKSFTPLDINRNRSNSITRLRLWSEMNLSQNSIMSKFGRGGGEGAKIGKIVRFLNHCLRINIYVTHTKIRCLRQLGRKMREGVQVRGGSFFDFEIKDFFFSKLRDGELKFRM